jgi:hypothetical protein
MMMTAPAGCAGISVGGATFNVVDGHINVPDGYSPEGIAALANEGFAVVAEAAPEPVAAPVPDYAPSYDAPADEPHADEPAVD